MPFLLFQYNVLSRGWLKICDVSYMNTLFPAELDFPDGFFYYPDFLSGDEEMSLYEEISAVELHDLEFKGFKASRRIASFGYDYSFGDNKLSKGKQIPK